PSSRCSAVIALREVCPALTWIFIGVLVAPLCRYGNPALALLAGMALRLALGQPLPVDGQRWGRITLQTAIVLLGASLSFGQVIAVSGHNLPLVASYVCGVLIAGYLIGRALRVEQNSNLLMTSGTAICGGTAIATIAPIIEARPEQVGAAIAIVFLLNAVALF